MNVTNEDLEMLIANGEICFSFIGDIKIVVGIEEDIILEKILKER